MLTIPVAKRSAELQSAEPQQSFTWPEQGLKLAVKNTFFTVETDDEGEFRNGSKSCMARMSQSSSDWCFEETDPTRSHILSGTTVDMSEGSSVAISEWSTQCRDPGHGITQEGESTPEPEPMGSQPVTFLLPVVTVTAPSSIGVRAKSQSATTTASAPLPPPPSYNAPLAFQDMATAPPMPETSARMPEPSIGSRFHDVVCPDGEPGCQPCAWFWKPSSCEFKQTCKFCHMCPDGELKRRKKQKVMRLRLLEQEEKDRAMQQQTRV